MMTCEVKIFLFCYEDRRRFIMDGIIFQILKEKPQKINNAIKKYIFWQSQIRMGELSLYTLFVAGNVDTGCLEH